jgi:hypothetical protein
MGKKLPNPKPSKIISKKRSSISKGLIKAICDIEDIIQSFTCMKIGLPIFEIENYDTYEAGISIPVDCTGSVKEVFDKYQKIIREIGNKIPVKYRQCITIDVHITEKGE